MKYRKDKLSLGLFLSFVWILMGSFCYFDYLFHYENSYEEVLELGLSGNDYFGHEKDIERKDRALQYASEKGRREEAEVFLAMGLEFLKPVLKLTGLIWLTFIPVLFAWCLMLFLLRKRNMYILSGFIYVVFLALSGLIPFSLIYLFVVTCLLLSFYVLMQLTYCCAYQVYRAKRNLKNN